jgi:hypothetical protein
VLRREDGRSLVPDKTDKVIPLHSMKLCRGSEGIAPLILNLGARWREVFTVTIRSEVEDWRIRVKDERYLDLYKYFSCRLLFVAVRSLCLRGCKNTC